MNIEEYFINGGLRYRIVSAKDPEIVIDDAQGYGFRTYENALSYIKRKKVKPAKAVPEVTIMPLF